MDSTYLREHLGRGRVRFSVMPASSGRDRRTPMVLAGSAGLLVAAASGLPSGVVDVVLRLVVGCAAGFWIHRAFGRWLRIDEERRAAGGSFIASVAGLESIDGERLAGDRLMLSVRRRSRKPGLGRVSYALVTEAGDRTTTLAGGMSEVTALALLDDTRRALAGIGEGGVPLHPPHGDREMAQVRAGP